MPMFNVWENDQISYREQADKLFNLPAWQLGSAQDQQIIPFLGAGVSISRRNFPSKPLSGELPNVEAIDKVAHEFGLESKKAKNLLRIAVFLAISLERAEKDAQDLNDDQLFEFLLKEDYPPSGGELSRLF